MPSGSRSRVSPSDTGPSFHRICAAHPLADKREGRGRVEPVEGDELIVHDDVAALACIADEPEPFGIPVRPCKRRLLPRPVFWGAYDASVHQRLAGVSLFRFTARLEVLAHGHGAEADVVDALLIFRTLGEVDPALDQNGAQIFQLEVGMANDLVERLVVSLHPAVAFSTTVKRLHSRQHCS